MTKWSSIKPGDTIEWEETLCAHRGTYRIRKLTVAWRRGKNIRGVDGEDAYWGSAGLGNSSTKVTPNETPITNKPV